MRRQLVVRVVLCHATLGTVLSLGAIVAAASLDRTSAASGCPDTDGDGVVHITDFVIWSNYFGMTVPPAPPQLDLIKDGALSIGDQASLLSQFDLTTGCQTDPLPKTTLAGAALVVDAHGEDSSPNDPVDDTRATLIGETFHVSVHLTSNPGIVAYQMRLQWDEPLLELNPRTAAENALLAPFFGPKLQSMGPADDGTGSDAYIELSFSPYQAPSQASSVVGPVAQFELPARTRARPVSL